MKIKFLGAAGTVTGSSYLLTPASGDSILIDLGAFQGSPELEALNHEPLACSIPDLAGMVLTHAHLDHCGRVPILAQNNFGGEIFMTEPTWDMAGITLIDSAHIAREQKLHPPLFSESDVHQIEKHFHIVNYDESFELGSFTITFRDAGHILGSSSVEIVDNSSGSPAQKIVFSGDLGNTPEDLILPTRLIDAADIVVMESTYGGRVHPTEDPSDMIRREINAIEASGGTLLIPSFSIERFQELLHRISHLKARGLIKIGTPVFADSPMAEKVTVLFEKYRNLENAELQADFKTGDPFRFPGLTFKEPSSPKVIIAGSGMMTGGRIVDHAKTYLPDPKTRVLIVGYQAENTLGRQLLEGQKTVKINGHPVTVDATISETQALSSHADEPRLLTWLSHIQGVKQVFLTHGEDEPRKILSEKITSQLGISNILMPHLGETHETTS